MWENLKAKVLLALRTSEFYVVLGQIVVEALGAPIPGDLKAVAWLYVAFRILGKLAAYFWPNPDNTAGGFLKRD